MTTREVREGLGDQAGLAHPAHAGDGDQPAPGQVPRELGELPLAAEERRGGVRPRHRRRQRDRCGRGHLVPEDPGVQSDQ